MAVIASCGTGAFGLLTAFASGFDILGIVERVGAIGGGVPLGGASEAFAFELSIFGLELCDVVLECFDSLECISVSALPVSGLLAEFEVFAFECGEVVLERGQLGME